MSFGITGHEVEGSLSMNKLIMASDFKVEVNVELQEKVNRMVEVKKGV
jgi:hypothetical protein